MVMKKAFYTVVVITILALSLIPACTAAVPDTTPAPQKITLNFVDQWKLDHFVVKNVMEVFAEIEKRSKGRLEIIRTGGAEIIPAADQLTACGKGSIDMVVGATTYFAGVVPEAAILGLPVVPWNFNTEFKLSYAVGDDLDKIFQKKVNVKCLLSSYCPCGMYIFTNTKEVTSVADMKGLKIRTIGGLDSLLLDALGAVPTRVASAEVYSAAERGIIDGGSRPTAAVIDWKEYEVWKYMVKTPLSFQPLCQFFINLDTWNKLPSDIQKLLIDTPLAISPSWLKYYEDTENAAIAALAAKGVKVVDLKPDEIKKWQSIPVPVAEAYFLKQNPENGQLLLDELKTAAK
jgi:TRAP-type C4-dicarboxylate transport system substrate-binding protein